MHKKTHYQVLVITLIFAIFMLTGCQEDTQEQAIGEVNGDTITQKQFDQHYQMVLSWYQQNYGEVDEKNDQELAANLRDSSFQDLVVQKLILQESE